MTYAYYPDGSVQEIDRGTNSVKYNYYETGQKQQIWYDKIPAIQYRYDAQGRLLSIQNTSAAGSLSSYEYAYDFDHSSSHQPIWKGYRTAMRETIMPSTVRDENYYYDSLYQLTKTSYGDLHKDYEWAYDDIGNRISQTITDKLTAAKQGHSAFALDSYAYYTIGSNAKNSQLLKHDGHSCYLWDYNGNLACKWQAPLSSCPDKPHIPDSTCPALNPSASAEGDSSNTWDIEDRLIGMQWYENDPNNPIHLASYFYSYNGDRYNKIIDNVTSNYLYHNEDIIKEEINSSIIYEYLHGPGIDEPAIQMGNSSNPAYYYADGLGSIRQLTDSSGSMLNQYRYGSWGELSLPFIQTGSFHNFYAYTSRELSEKNLYYYRARYYSSQLGIFISNDPLSLIFKYPYTASLKRYSYSFLNPINYFDPFGMKSCDACKDDTVEERRSSPKCCNLNAWDCEKWGAYCQKNCARCLYVDWHVIKACQNWCMGCENDCKEKPNNFKSQNCDFERKWEHHMAGGCVTWNKEKKKKT